MSGAGILKMLRTKRSFDAFKRLNFIKLKLPYFDLTKLASSLNSDTQNENHDDGDEADETEGNDANNDNNNDDDNENDADVADDDNDDDDDDDDDDDEDEDDDDESYGPDIADDEVDDLDEDKMMTHILDCIAALAEKQRVRVALKRPLRLQMKPGDKEGRLVTAEQQASRNKVFKAALGLLAEGLTHDGDKGAAVADDGRSKAAVRQLATAFPNSSKLSSGRRWLPLHWAVVAASVTEARGGLYDVTEADVKAVYALDPGDISCHHIVPWGTQPLRTEPLGFMPTHLLCMGAVTEQTKSLIRFFSEDYPQRFAAHAKVHPYEACVFGSLYVACAFGQPTEWLLQHLLQLDSSACKSQIFAPNHPSLCSTPLGALCQYSAGRVDERLLRCLLSADSSAEVVYDGIRGCLTTKVLTNRVEAVTLLLEANPQAAYDLNGDGSTLALLACRYSNSDCMSGQECIDILKLLLAENRDAFMIIDSAAGRFPVHYLALHGPVEALEYLLDACPEVPATTACTNFEYTLLHYVLIGPRRPDDDKVAKARLLCSRYPAVMLQRDRIGWTPLHMACSYQFLDILPALCEAGGREVASAPVVHPTDPNHEHNGWLPLHGLLSSTSDRLREDSLLSPLADVFRLLLRLYPEAAGIAASDDGVHKKTPYQFAVESCVPVYYRRLLLRAAPHLDPAALRRLNWQERRTAMYMAYAATFPKGAKPALLARFRLENPDMVKHVVSFL